MCRSARWTWAPHGRGGIKEDTRQKILQIARQIGYTPICWTRRRASAAKSRARVGVCMPREIHFFYDQLSSGVLDEVHAASLKLGIQARIYTGLVKVIG